MQTKLIEGVSLRSNDDKVLAAANKGARDGGGNTMVIGVRNEAGQIYRGIETVGMGEFMAVVGALHDLGLTDELADAFDMREGCDAIFS